MAQDQLTEFLHMKKEKAKPIDVDWAAKLDAWNKAVDELYRTIADDYLKAVKDEVVIDMRDKVVTENLIGEYHIPELVLGVGDEEVVFSPKGINIVAAKGRIDIRGDRGDATLIWQDGSQWSVVASRSPVLRLIPLTADSLADVLKGIMRP